MAAAHVGSCTFSAPTTPHARPVDEEQRFVSLPIDGEESESQGQDLINIFKPFDDRSEKPSFLDAMGHLEDAGSALQAKACAQTTLNEAKHLKVLKFVNDSIDVDDLAVIREWTKNTIYNEITSATVQRNSAESAEVCLAPVVSLEYKLMKAVSNLPDIGNLNVRRLVCADLSRKYAVGDEFHWWAPTSTTKCCDMSVLKGFAIPGCVYTVFDLTLLPSGGAGRAIDRYSKFEKEGEVLLLPGSKFKVTRVEQEVRKEGEVEFKVTRVEQDVLQEGEVGNIFINAVELEPKLLITVPPRQCALEFKGLSLVVIGNPGVGKSSLINCYAQQLLFKSGTSANASGMTHQLDAREHDGRRYMDTPGLADLKLRQAAAESITKALQQGGDFKVMFVMTTEAGRLKPDDLTTMKLVLQAANQIKENQYSLLINKCKKKWLQTKLNRHEWMAAFRESLEHRDIPVTDYVHFAPYLEDLDEADDEFAKLDEETQRFIDNAPSFNIKRDKVQNVEYHTFEELSAELGEQLCEMEAANAELEKTNMKLGEELQQQEEAKKAELERMEKEKQAEIQRQEMEKRAELARLEAGHQRKQRERVCADVKRALAAVRDKLLKREDALKLAESRAAKGKFAAGASALAGAALIATGVGAAAGAGLLVASSGGVVGTAGYEYNQEANAVKKCVEACEDAQTQLAVAAELDPSIAQLCQEFANAQLQSADVEESAGKGSAMHVAKTAAVASIPAIGALCFLDAATAAQPSIAVIAKKREMTEEFMLKFNCIHSRIHAQPSLGWVLGGGSAAGLVFVVMA